MPAPSDAAMAGDPNPELMASLEGIAKIKPEKKPKRVSPTQRTRAHCKKLGYLSQIVEKWVNFPPPGHRVDLFGFVDVLAVSEGRTYAIQTTVGSSHAARRTKIESECSEAVGALLEAGWLIEVWSWTKAGARGKLKRWTLRRERLTGPNTWTAIDDAELETEDA